MRSDSPSVLDCSTGDGVQSKLGRGASGKSDGSLGLSDMPYLPKKRSASRFNPLKHLGDVRGIELYSSSVVVRRERVSRGPKEQLPKRQEITELSKKSLARLAFVAFNTDVDFQSIITLTYPAKYSNDGKEVKRHINRFLEWFRYRFPGEKYLWFLEFQKRGAPHLHVVTTVDLARLGSLATIKRKGGKSWRTHYETWQSLERYWGKLGGGFTSWEVVRDQDGGKKYASTYATKAYQKQVSEEYQNVGRFWGYSRDGVKPEPVASYVCSEDQLRAALERGGWDYVPDDGGMVYKELYQASEKVETDGLQVVDSLDFEPVGPVVMEAFKDRGGRLLVYQKVAYNYYQCMGCGDKFARWSGQCPECGEWNSLQAFSDGI